MCDILLDWEEELPQFWKLPDLISQPPEVQEKSKLWNSASAEKPSEH